MNDMLETPAWGSFALVSYVPDPLRSFLHKLRQNLPGKDDAQPHITILPPRPLKLPVDAASQVALKELLEFSAFPVELSRVRLFPNTRFLYLDVAKGRRLLNDLHATLNRGDLKHAEQFDFLPHLTLGGPVEAADLKTVVGDAEAAWRNSTHPREFLLDEIVFLWLRPNRPDCEWH